MVKAQVMNYNNIFYGFSETYSYKEYSFSINKFFYYAYNINDLYNGYSTGFGDGYGVPSEIRLYDKSIAGNGYCSLADYGYE